MPRQILKKESSVERFVSWLCCGSTAFFCLLTMGIAAVGEIVLDDYRAGLSPQWEKKIFSGETLYTVVRDGDQDCIKAVSAGTASGLVYKIDYSPEEYPFLSWKWKVEHVLQHGDERSKKTDDYAARVYVVFPSLFFWKTRALNYIWANKIPRDQQFPTAIRQTP
jgi:uncharacterized membrane protein